MSEMKQEYLILRETRSRIRAHVFIGGSEPFTDAVLKLQLADCNMPNAMAKVLAETSVVVAARPACDWVVVDLEFDWPKERYEFILWRMSLLAEIRSKELGKLLYITKVTHPIDLEHAVGYYWTHTVVVEKV